jgi:hypothetical protein
MTDGPAVGMFVNLHLSSLKAERYRINSESDMSAALSGSISDWKEILRNSRRIR